MENESERLRRATDVTVRLVLVALLVYWCFAIFRPFLMPTVLGVVFAVALAPVHVRLERLLGNRKKLAAILLVVLCVAAFLVPTLLLSGSLIDGVRGLSSRLQAETLEIPPAPAKIATWPVVGQPIFDLWNRAATDLDTFVKQLQPQVKAAGLWLVGVVRGAVVDVIVILVALLIAGFLWVQRENTVGAAVALGTRIGGERGAALVPFAGRAIVTVAKGVVGVAAIQAALAALGFLVAGVPAAGLWTLLVLILAIAQLPPLLILGPAILYVVARSDSTLTVVLFTVWSLVVSFSDAVLKPLLMGRGSDVPVAVILIGAIGGLVLHGLVGLFVGAVVFSIGHGLISEWIRQKS